MAVSPVRRGAVRRRMELDPTTGVDSARAWLVALAAFSASFVAFGVMYSFGVFLSPVAAEFRAEPAAAAAFFSIASVVYYGVAALAGRIADRLGPRIIVAAGAAILGLGLCLGPPLAGLAIDWSGSSRGSILFALAAGLLGVFAVLPVRSGMLRHAPK